MSESKPHCPGCGSQQLGIQNKLTVENVAQNRRLFTEFLRRRGQKKARA